MNIMGLKIFESYKDNKHNNSKHNNSKHNNSKDKKTNYNNNTSNNNNSNNNSKYDAKTNKKFLSINPDTNNDIRDELYSLYIINNV